MSAGRDISASGISRFNDSMISRAVSTKSVIASNTMIAF